MDVRWQGVYSQTVHDGCSYACPVKGVFRSGVQLQEQQRAWLKVFRSGVQLQEQQRAWFKAVFRSGVQLQEQQRAWFKAGLPLRRTIAGTAACLV
ncbi:hypothetical protein [Longitalea luteola]|uniref:hypothetical protein n=1 Tax=Longitalea luteola TaxID=2812563 RepID=UPI001A9776E0|nr:hypothetical protein [Longitalea luteola]